MSAIPAPSLSAEFLTLRIRRFAGYVMFVFVTMHLANHTLLMVSLRLAQEASRYLVGPWQTVPGEILLYGALFYHAGLALWTLYSRRTLMMPPGEMIQFVFGLLIPYLLIDHVLSTGVARMAFGWTVDYRDVLRSFWVDNPGLGVQQAIGVVVVWTHGCLGLARAFPRQAERSLWAVLALVVAVLLPVLALTGFAGVGRTIAIYGPRLQPLLPAYQAELRPLTEAHMLAMAGTSARGAYTLLIGGVLILRQLRAVWHHATGIDVSYEVGNRVHVPLGTTLLEASRANNIAHYSVCGGNGRCSTCRVRVLWSEQPLPPPNEIEAATLRRISAPADVRLACQLRPASNIQVERVLAPSVDASRPDELGAPPEERSVAILFCDLRDFTAFSEQHLPYDVVFLLNRYFEVVGTAVGEEGGRVDKFIGDGAMAIFGLDSDFETACRGAMRAAARIRRGVKTLSAELRQEPALNLNAVVGVHAGSAIVGQMGVPGASTMTAVGDTVNVASRLESIAKEEGAAIVASAAVIAGSGIDAQMVPTREVMIRGRQSEERIYVFSDADAAVLE